MNFNQISNFLCVCEVGGITQAAKKLFISQSALSQQIRRIEEEMNVQLFTYDGKQLQLTPKGVQFREQARQIYTEYVKLREIMAYPQQEERREVLNLAVTKHHSMIAALYLVPRFNKLFPNVQINIVEVNSFEVEIQLLEKKVDFGFCSPPNNLPIQTEYIFSSEILVAIPFHNEINRHRHKANGYYPLITLDELRTQTFIRLNHGSPREFFGEMYFTAHNFTPRYCAGSHQHDVIQRLVAAGYGCAFIPELNAYDQFSFYDQPIYYSTGDERLFKPLKIGYLMDSFLTPAMRDFIEFAKQELPNMRRELPLNTALHHTGDYFSLEEQNNQD